MATDRSGGGGVPRINPSSSSFSSLAFIDVAFADTPLSPDDEGSYELQAIDGSAVPDRRYLSRSTSSVGASHQPLGAQDRRTRRPSLAFRFYLREFVHGETQNEGPIDDEGYRDNTKSAVSIDTILPSSARGNQRESRREQQQPVLDVAIFSSDPTEKAMHSGVRTWRLLWIVCIVLLVFEMFMAAVSQLSLSFLFREYRDIRLATEKKEGNAAPLAPYSMMIHAPPLKVTEWLPTQIGSDCLYAVLVLISIFRWCDMQRRLRVAVLMRYLTCLLVAFGMKLILSLAFGFAYRPMGTHVDGTSYWDTAVLVVRFLSGMLLSEDSDGIPGYGRMVVSQLVVYWFLYTWRTPYWLLPPTFLGLGIFILSSVSGLRSVFDTSIAILLVLVISVFYHQLLDSAAKDLFLKLRDDVGTQEAQMNQRSSSVYTPMSRVSRRNVSISSYFGYAPHGGFIARFFWEAMSAGIGRFEHLEQRVRYTLRDYGLYLAQQRNVHFVAPERTVEVEEKDGGLPVATQSLSSAAGMSGARTLVDDRMVWAAICECYTPRPPTFFGKQQLKKIVSFVQKCGCRGKENNKAPPGLAPHVP